MIDQILSSVRRQFSPLFTYFRISNGNVEGSEYVLLLMTLIYSATSTMSSIFENRVLPRKCEPVIPFAECPVGESEAKFPVITEYSKPRLWISFAVVIVAGIWSDKYGRQRKLLILIPIIGQIFSNFYYYHYASVIPRFAFDEYDNIYVYIVNFIFTKIIPGIYAGRYLFWIGAMSYISENSTVEMRTLKITKLIATYAISSLIGLGLVKMLDMEFNEMYNFRLSNLFIVPICLNILAGLIGIYFLKDTSEPYQHENMLWIRPLNMVHAYDGIFHKNRKMVLKMLLSCQISVVVKIGVEYVVLMHFLTNTLRDDETTFFYFSVSRTVALVFGALFSGVLSKCMNVHDLVIGILTCCLYIVAAISYIFVNRFYQLIIFAMIYFCHGSIIVITASLTSKVVEIRELGRLNSFQAAGATISTLAIGEIIGICNNPNENETIHLCFMVLIYALLTVPMLIMFMFLYFKRRHLCQSEITSNK